MNRYQNQTLTSGGFSIRSVAGIIRDEVEAGTVSTSVYVLKSGERLDILADKFYGDGKLWWIIAAASGVGWWLQATPGTILRIPEFEDIEGYI